MVFLAGAEAAPPVILLCFGVCITLPISGGGGGNCIHVIRKPMTLCCSILLRMQVLWSGELDRVHCRSSRQL